MELELDSDFYFGNASDDIVKLDYNELRNFKGELINIPIAPPIYWQKGILSIDNKYSHYILLGEYYCLSTWVFTILRKLQNKKIYFWTHGWYGNESSLKKVVKKLFFNLADGILLYGNHAKELMIKEGFEPKKLHVIYNSLDYNKQFSIRQSLNSSPLFEDRFGNNNKVILFIGRLTKVKRLDQLIELISNCKKAFERNLNLVIVGTGVEEHSLQTLVEEKGLNDQVWFYGESYNEELNAQLIYNADICVSPGNVGLTAMHSLMYGTPVITHNDYKNQMPEFEAIESGITGDFFQKDNIEDLTNVILNWIDDNENRFVVRERCYNIMDRIYNPDFQVKILKSLLYNETIPKEDLPKCADVHFEKN
ncbi:hypothetical protein GCM10007049_04400 [Echinicola pacifica]|uniref:Glycosyl transferase family 1 domain-containing protein n=1 Tax=Echinicola pacifica TaxID=346377 RepID=A0A918PN42_9BACT|nr:glycosyltransferase [Echinicola pacifica]GGZ15423.1 hypothetical protein GCM10007049_04400 [Echinicola pacifica]